jgi:hypothetical protein
VSELYYRQDVRGDGTYNIVDGVEGKRRPALKLLVCDANASIHHINRDPLAGTIVEGIHPCSGLGMAETSQA